MSLAALKASLTLWRQRRAYRRGRLTAARREAHAHAGVTKAEAARIHKWERLAEQAEAKVARRLRQIAEKSPGGARVVAAAERAAANYRRNPGAYHYLAGGKANTVIMAPTPSDWRSDCSQFAVNVYREAGIPDCPGTGTWEYSNTRTIGAFSGGGRPTTRPKPGALGLYGPRGGGEHHVEVRTGPGRFIGHGSPPIDSITPGLPTFYLEFLDA